MLSRTADHLFWMSRYIERAENLARLLDVTWQMSMLCEENNALLDGLQAQGMRIHAYGASAKSTTLLNYYGLDAHRIPCVVDSTQAESKRAARLRGWCLNGWPTTDAGAGRTRWCNPNSGSGCCRPER